MPGCANKVIRYAIYTRQSVDKGDEFSSCEAQFVTCRDFAKETREPGVHWIGERFDAEGRSGATLDRPAMRRLRQVIEEGGIHRLYAVALDRLSRNMRDTLTLLDEMDRAEVELCLVHESHAIPGAQNRFLRNILAAFAEFERDITATRTAETRAYLKRHGRRLAGPAPYGYDAHPVTKQLVPHSKEARRVRLIFGRAAEGQTPKEIARRVNHLGWRTKQWVARRSGRPRGGGRWTARLVTALLRNPVYLGRFVDGKGTRAGSHAAIVTEEVFRAAQAALDRRRTVPTRCRQRLAFPLRGKIICPKCKRRLNTYVITRRVGHTTVGYRYYRCRSNAGGRLPCSSVSYPAWEVEQFVRGQLGDEATWARLLRSSGQRRADAGACSTIWQSLDSVEQDRLLPDLVESVEFRRKNTEMRITFTDRFLEGLSSCRT
jgi:DNA invertase Pin-like site-specific DNA recombinase